MEAYNTGYEAARRGEPSSDKPYPDGSWDSEQWDEGWADAMEWYSFFGLRDVKNAAAKQRKKSKKESRRRVQ